MYRKTKTHCKLQRTLCKYRERNKRTSNIYILMIFTKCKTKKYGKDKTRATTCDQNYISDSPYLHHLSVYVEAGIAKLCDLLGQQLHPLSGVTEDD